MNARPCRGAASQAKVCTVRLIRGRRLSPGGIWLIWLCKAGQANFMVCNSRPAFTGFGGPQQYENHQQKIGDPSLKTSSVVCGLGATFSTWAAILINRDGGGSGGVLARQGRSLSLGCHNLDQHDLASR